ncbi:virion structural protein [Cyanophage PSS2]|uniref:virion structural protein n=1 Tax=Cyanophage PSS2 TaxID=658401 RepID=UPI0001B0401F|nr:virion structural protein [Cyanophage PSS2]ACT65635.1 fiber protein [Cyanophage PSS2]
MSIPGSAIPLLLSQATEAAPYRIAKSLRFNDSDNAYLRRVWTSPGDRRTWTFSCWVKRTHWGSEKQGLFGLVGDDIFLRFNNDDGGSNLRFLNITQGIDVVTKRKLRDVSAWYHIVLVLDTTEAVDTDRIKIFVNGERETEFYSATWPSQYAEGTINNMFYAHGIGVANSDYFDGLMSEIHFIDGQALDCNSFGETDEATGQWVAKKFSGGYSVEDADGSSSPHVLVSGTPNAEDNVSYLNSNPDSSSFPLIQSSSLGNATVKIKFDSAQTGVANIKFRGGGYAAGSTYTLKVNGTQLGGTQTTASGWTEVEFALSVTDVTDIEITGSDGFAIGQLKLNSVMVSGTPSYGTLGVLGKNSFYLKFEGDPEGFVWSDGMAHNSSGWSSSQGPEKAFNGVAGASTDMANCSSAGGNITWTFPAGSNLSGSVRVWVGNAGARVFSNAGGGTQVGTNEGSGGSWVTCSGDISDYNGAIMITPSSDAPSLAAIEINGEILVDAQKDVGSDASGNNNHFETYNFTEPLEAWTPGCWYYSSTLYTQKTDIQANAYKFENGAGGTIPSGNYIYFIPSGEETEGAHAGSEVFNGSYDLNSTYTWWRHNGASWMHTSGAGGYGNTDTPHVWGWNADGTNYMLQPTDNFYLLSNNGTSSPGQNFGTVPSVNTVAGDQNTVDVSIDSPTSFDDGGNGTGNYCTLNSLDTSLGDAVNNGNLNTGAAGFSGWELVRGTFGVSSGKWYWEGTKGGTTVNSSNGYQFGLMLTSLPIANGPYQTGCYSVQGPNFYRKPASDVMDLVNDEYKTHAFAVDLDAGTIQFYSDGVLRHTETGIPEGTYAPFGGSYGGPDVTFNFGARPFKFAPPDGYKALNAFNLSDPTITDPSKHFDVKLYTGTGADLTIGGNVYSGEPSVTGGTLTNAADAFNGSSSNWATITSTDTSTACHVDFTLPTPLTGVTQIEMAFDSPSGSGDTRGRYNGANAGDTRTGTSSGYSHVYSGSPITVTSVGWGINQNGATGTSSDIVSRIRITIGSEGYILTDDRGGAFNFGPDFVWFKQRTGSQYHMVADIVRGGVKQLYPHDPGAEASNAHEETTFTSDGVGVSTGNTQNQSGESHIVWAWNAGTETGRDANLYPGDSFSSGSVSTTGTLMQPWTKAFDGSTGNYDQGVYTYNGGSTTLTFSPPVTWSNKIRFFVRKYGGGMYMNGSAYDLTQSLDLSGGYFEGWFDATSIVGGTGTIESLKVTDVGNNYVSLQAIELDDKELRDVNPTISAGAYNDDVYWDEFDWSSAFSNNAGNTTDVGQAFRGKLNETGVGVSTSFVSLTTLAFTANQSISLWIHNPAGIGVVIEYNGVEYTKPGVDFGWTHFIVGTDIPASPGYNTGTFKVKLASSGDECRGVMIDGKILVDNDQTPPDLPNLPSTFRANPGAGFSIVTATADSTPGAQMSLAHGLNAKPDFIVAKDRDNGSTNWAVYHSAIGATKKLDLDLDGAMASNVNYWSNTEPTSNVLYTNSGSWMYSSAKIVLYCWSEVAGYSKFSTYEGNGSEASGPFAFCGFKPAFLLLKDVDGGGYWAMHDSTRDPRNDGDKQYLWANVDGMEFSGFDIDWLANGFRLRNGNGNWNSSKTYAFAAFSESPFKYTNAI